MPPLNQQDSRAPRPHSDAGSGYELSARRWASDTNNARIDFSAPQTVRAALARVGRTENVAVSPTASRLALAAFSRNTVDVFSFAIRRSADSVAISVSAHVSLSCDRFSQPHGCSFLDAEHLLVCNRGGDVTLVRVPEPHGASQEVQVEPLASISGQRYLGAVVKTPGSVAAYRVAEGRFKAFVCSDQWHFVTSHLVTLGEHPKIAHEGVRIENTLQIPDGIALSSDHQWIAISNHVQGEVLLFRNSPELNRHTRPEAILGGSVCPHGLSFDADGSLYVADAASPYVHRYQKPIDGWRDQCVPSTSFRMLDSESFYQGRYAAREGGVKGVHVEQSTGVLITTHKLGTLEFHDLRSLASRPSKVDAQELTDLRLARDAEIALSKSDVLRRRWNLRTRLRREIDDVVDLIMKNVHAVAPLLNRKRLQYVNEHSTSPLLDPAGPVLSMTSHSTRIAWAHLAIESIAEGSLKPRRMLLWLSHDEAKRTLPAPLRRLQARGLEIRYSRDFGPHTKYFPYVASEAHFDEPLVTADDDIIYPRDWLAGLVRAHQRDPDSIHCHVARRMRLNRRHFEPYGNWAPATSTEPHPLNFVIGAGGAIYPARFLQALKNRGDAFEGVCPTADDIWLNWVAHREGFLVAQVSPVWLQYWNIPATQLIALYHVNGGGGNQLQLASTYCDRDRAELLAKSHVG